MAEFLSSAQRLYEQALAEPHGGPTRAQLQELLRRRGQHELARELEGLEPGLEPPTGTRDGQPLRAPPPPPAGLSWGLGPLFKRLLALLLVSGLTLGLIGGYVVYGPGLEQAWRTRTARGQLSSPDPSTRLAAAGNLISSGAAAESLPELWAALAPERLDGGQQRQALELVQRLDVFPEPFLRYLVSALEHAADARTWELAAKQLRKGWGLHYDLDGGRRPLTPLPAVAYARLLKHCELQPARRHLLLRGLCNRPPDADPQPVLGWLVACCQSEDPEQRRCGRELLPELLEVRGPEALVVDGLLTEAVPEALRVGGDLEYAAGLKAGLALGMPEALEHYLTQVRHRTERSRWKRRQRKSRSAAEDLAELAESLDAYDGDALRAAHAREDHPGAARVLAEALRRYERRNEAWRD